MSDLLQNSNTEAKTQNRVRCPSCQTEFSVNKATIEQFELPTFHCSKCDNVFTINEEIEDILEESQVLASQMLERQQAEIQQKQEQPTIESKPTQLVIEEEESKEQEQEQDIDQEVEEAQEEELSPKTEQQVSQIVDAIKDHAVTPVQEDIFEEASYETKVMKISEPTGEAAERLQKQSIPQDLTKVPAEEEETKEEEDAVQMPLGLRETAPRIQKLDDTLTPEDFNPAEALESDTPEYSGQAFAAEHSRESLVETTQNLNIIDQVIANNHDATTIASPYKSVFVFCAPILAFLVILFGCGYVLSNNNAFSNSISSLLFPVTPSVAPAGLRIKNTSYSRLALSNGDLVPVISGVVVNNTSETFHQVVVEGLAFDASGQSLVRSKLTLAASLSKDRIKNLDLELIDNLQSSASNKYSNLEPGGSLEFNVALLKEDVSQARFYTARIFSVY